MSAWEKCSIAGDGPPAEMLHVNSLSPDKSFGAVDGTRRLALQELYGVLSDCHAPIIQKRHDGWQERVPVWSRDNGDFPSLRHA